MSMSRSSFALRVLEGRAGRRPGPGAAGRPCSQSPRWAPVDSEAAGPNPRLPLLSMPPQFGGASSRASPCQPHPGSLCCRGRALSGEVG